MKSDNIRDVLVLSVLLLGGVCFQMVGAQSTSDGTSADEDTFSDSGNFPLRSSDDTWAGNYDERDAADRFEHVRTGERVEVRLTNGAQLQGEVIGLLGDRIQIEISNERLTMSGTITLRSDNIDSITKLDSLTQAERKRIQSIKKQYQANVRSAATGAGSGDSESDTAGSQEADESSEQESGSADASDKGDDQQNEEQEDDDEKEGPPELTSEQQTLLDRFPAEEWNRQRYQSLQKKYNFQRNSTQDAFLENWEKLQKAREIQEKRREYQLLQEFHPDDGWTPEEYRYIKENLASLEAKGIPVRSGEQRRFLEVYDQWQEAYERYKKRQKKKQQENKGGNDSGSSSEQAEEPQQGTLPSPKNGSSEPGTND